MKMPSRMESTDILVTVPRLLTWRLRLAAYIAIFNAHLVRLVAGADAVRVEESEAAIERLRTEKCDLRSRLDHAEVAIRILEDQKTRLLNELAGVREENSPLRPTDETPEDVAEEYRKAGAEVHLLPVPPKEGGA